MKDASLVLARAFWMCHGLFAFVGRISKMCFRIHRLNLANCQVLLVGFPASLPVTGVACPCSLITENLLLTGDHSAFYCQLINFSSRQQHSECRNNFILFSLLLIRIFQIY